MGWRRRWPEQTRTPRPEVRRLTDGEKTRIVQALERGIAASPVLSEFGIQVRVARGRFYIERPWQDENSEACREVWGRITPLTGPERDLLLEVEHRRGNWSKVARGQAAELARTIASDTKGTFHGLGRLDASLRRLGTGRERLPVTSDDNQRFVYADSGERCSVQEALFHGFGLPIDVIAEPSDWYLCHRTPMIAEVSEDRTRILVHFTAMTFSGDSFGGTCLYLQRDGQWGAWTIRPSESETIAQAEAWLVKRKWRAW